MPYEGHNRLASKSADALSRCEACSDDAPRQLLDGVEVRIHGASVVDSLTSERTVASYPARLRGHRVSPDVIEGMQESLLGNDGTRRSAEGGFVTFPPTLTQFRVASKETPFPRQTHELAQHFVLGATRIQGGPLDGFSMRQLGYSDFEGNGSGLFTEKGQYEDRKERDRFPRESDVSIAAALQRAKEKYPKAKDVGEVDNEFETVTGKCDDEFIGQSKAFTRITYYLYSLVQPVGSEPTGFNLRHAAKKAGERAYGEPGERLSFEDVAAAIKLLFRKREGEEPVHPPAHAEAALRKKAEDSILNNMFFTRFKCEPEEDCAPVFELLGWHLVNVTEVLKSEPQDNEVPSMPGSFAYKVEKNGVWYIVSGVRFELEMEWDYVFRVVCEGAKEESF